MSLGHLKLSTSSNVSLLVKVGSWALQCGFVSATDHFQYVVDVNLQVAVLTPLWEVGVGTLIVLNRIIVIYEHNYDSISI